VSATPSYDVLVRRNDLRELRVDEHPAPSATGLAPGSASLPVDGRGRPEQGNVLALTDA